MRRAILLFLKYPEPGQVKTRLAATLGANEAAEIYRHLTAAVCASLPPDATPLILFDPPDRHDEIARWLATLDVRSELIPQASGNLTARLTAAFAHAFSLGYDAVAAIGSDCIDLNAGTFAETWAALASADVVLGPTFDGGYYLIALRRFHPALFDRISWSTASVLEETLARAAQAKLSVHLLPKCRDVDTEEDWRAVAPRIAARSSCQKP